MKNKSLLISVIMFLIFILFMISCYFNVNFVFTFLIYFLPLPLATYIYQNDLESGTLFFLGTALLSFIFLPTYALFIVVISNLAGLIYAMLYKKNTSTGDRLLILTIIYTFEIIISALLITKTSDHNVLNDLREFMNYARNIFAYFNGNLTEIDILQTEVATKYLMATMVFIAFLNAFIADFICALLFPKIEHKKKENKLEPYFKLPVALSVLIIILIFISLLTGTNVINHFVMNIFFIVQIIFALEGLGVIIYYLNLNFKPLNSALLFVLLLIISFALYNYISYPLVALGLADSLFDIRKYLPKIKDKS
ncbi:MAG TPA: DUF2232 domain-containing protein [Tenericutes bacterium]|nr:DUF2232 domain-containing protein [Mycoplasmatota bacterium]